jgi:hypothetical protein
VDEACRKLVYPLLCCCYKDNANLHVSNYTCGVLVLWKSLSFGICRITFQMVECVGGVVMFGVPTVKHPFACDFLICCYLL